MNVLVTGHLGYIGAHLTGLLAQAGCRVTGVDLHLFRGCEWDALPEAAEELRTDFRELGEADLRGYDAVVHLAALSNDAMGELDEAVTYAVNREGSIALARAARAAGVPRFIFAGSCAIYGKGGDDNPLDETAELRPLTAYARSKVGAEAAIARLADEHFHPVFLRNATAYGYSPALRLDLVVNNLLAAALAYGEIRVHSDGKPWRPLVHCRDIARACLACLQAPAAPLGGQALNIGADEENYQVAQVAELVRQQVEKARIVYTGRSGPDPRDYRVSFQKLRKKLPAFLLADDVRSGIRELRDAFLAHRFSRADLESQRFIRIRTLVEKNRLKELK